MALTPEDVLRLAALARLEVSDADAGALAGQLTEVLRHVERLEGSPDDDVPGFAGAPTPGDAPTPRRADRPGADTLDRPPAEFAPEWRDGFFTVPRLPSHDSPAGEAP